MTTSEDPSPAEHIPAGNDVSASANRATDGEARAERIVIELSGGAISRRLGWTLALLGWMLLLLATIAIAVLWAGRQDYYDTTSGISERFFSGEESAQDKIAILRITGVIYDGAGFVKRQIDRIRDDENVRAVVVRVDSPGGTVSGSDYIFHHLKKLRIERDLPIVVSMGSIAASGGYYVAMAVGDQSNSIFAEPTTTTGSIGVIIPHYDVSGLLAKYDVKNDSIASHPRKQMLSMTKPIPEDERQLLEDHVNVLFDLFKERVQEGRPYLADHPEKLNELATGEIFTAARAKQLHLVDQIGFLEDAVDRAAELAKLDAEEVRVVRFNQPGPLIEIPFLTRIQSNLGVSGLGAPSLDPTSLGGLSPQLAALLELSTPRPYYLATSLTPFTSSYERNALR